MSFTEETSHGAHRSPIFILFGRPGSGKSTIADAIVRRTGSISNTNDYAKLEIYDATAAHRPSQRIRIIHMDLDCCIPQWMKDNFAKGMYPTLEQRLDFASDACRYVEDEAKKFQDDHAPHEAILVSFSFVNTDLRDYFHRYFQQSLVVDNAFGTNSTKLYWILIDTSAQESARRIRSRKGHFYDRIDESMPVRSEKRNSSIDSSNENNGKLNEWDFAPVTFDHLKVDGMKPVQTNVDIILGHMKEILVR